MRSLMFIALIAFFGGIFFIAVAQAKEASKKSDKRTAYDFTFDSIEEGEKINLADYKGKIILVVNTACLCGFHQQLGDMENLYKEYGDKGVVVLAVSSDDFGGQELDSAEEVKKYTDTNFKRTFPLTATTHVKGKEAHPFYKWAAKYAGATGTPKWNFHKYLISKDGKFVNWYASPTLPTSDKIKKAIEIELKK